MSDHRISETAPKSTGELSANIVADISRDRELLDALLNMEHQICCLRSMVNILGNMLDDNLVDVETQRKSGQGIFKIWLTDGQMNVLSFAWNDAIHRANLLEDAFYAAAHRGTAE